MTEYFGNRTSKVVVYDCDGESLKNMAMSGSIHCHFVVFFKPN